MTARRSASVAQTTLRPLLGALRLPLRWLARQEARVLLTALVVVLIVFGFIELAEQMQEGEMHAFDTRVLQLFRRTDDPALLIGPAWLPRAVTDITALGGTAVLAGVVLVTVGYLALEHRYGPAALVVVASAGGGLLSGVLKEAFARPRPDLVPHLILVEDHSFPSGHAMAAAVIYLTLGALLARFAARRRVRIYVIAISLVLTALIGITRVALGVHYPSDVMAGWTAGLAWSLLCWLAARYLQYRGAVEAPRSQKGK